MTPRRFISGFAFLVVAGAAFWLWSGRAGETDFAVVEMHAGQKNEARADVAAGVVERLEGTITLAAAVGEPARETEAITLTAGDAGRLTEEIELRALGEAAGLKLTTEQWAMLTEVALSHQAIRHAYEAEIATVSVAADGRQRIAIPVYGAAGEALRAAFYEGLRTGLGQMVAGEIERKLGAALEGRFAGFGVSVQTLDFDREVSGVAEMEVGRVTRTVVFWDGTSGGERLRTRRETYFPEFDDAAGGLWAPLLARLETDNAKKSRG